LKGKNCRHGNKNDIFEACMVHRFNYMIFLYGPYGKILTMAGRAATSWQLGKDNNNNNNIHFSLNLRWL
jgi:hypothetical protein